MKHLQYKLLYIKYALSTRTLFMYTFPGNLGDLHTNRRNGLYTPDPAPKLGHQGTKTQAAQNTIGFHNPEKILSKF